jgi:hypothetical protein
VLDLLNLDIIKLKLGLTWELGGILFLENYVRVGKVE